MAISSDTIKILLSKGANITLSANSKYTGDSVKIFVDLAVKHNCHLTVYAANYTSDTLKILAVKGGSNITIVA